MDTDYIVDLCASLSFEEEDDSCTSITEAMIFKERARLDRCLVRKVLCTKAGNRDTFKIAMNCA